MGHQTIFIRVLDRGQGLDLPRYQTLGSAGADVCAAETVTLLPGERKLVPLGFCLELPLGTEVQIRPRSGLAYKHGVTVLNAPGTVDSDFRGEVHVLLYNSSSEAFVVERGMRIAQMVVAHVHQHAFALADDLSETHRGSGGFGSTGL